MLDRARPADSLSMRGTSLIVLAWNQWELTRRCLDSLLATALDEVQLIVVDNGSTDATVEGIGAYLDRLDYVRLATNLGFVRGMNAGIAAARADNDVVLLNNDLEFIQHDWLGRLRDAAYASADTGIVGCRLLGPSPDDLVFHVGGFIEPDGLWGQQTESGQQERDVSQFPYTRRVQGIAFALAYIRRDCIARIGVLDEIFHSYFEDTDYCLRAADAGIASVVAGAVTLRHHQHGSTRDDGGFRARLWTQSRAAFAARWQQRLLALYRGTLHWQGHTRLPKAEATLARGLIGRLDARGWRLSFAAASPELLSSDDFRVMTAAQRALPGVADIAVRATPAMPGAGTPARVRAALLACEWEAWPTSAHAALADLDVIVVPDAFQAGLVRAAGVTAAVEIVPFGVDREYCHPHVRAPRHPLGRMVFLCIVETVGRDEADAIVRAFAAAFDAGDDVELLVYIEPGDDEVTLLHLLTPVVAQARATVRLIGARGFPAAERGQLYAAADVYLSARRGAGWDACLVEAIASGCVVAGSAWGSNADLLDNWGHAVAVGVRREDASHPGCHWHDINVDALAACLRDLHERRAGVTALARERALTFAARHSFDATADMLDAVFSRHAGIAAPALPRPHRARDVGTRLSQQIVVLGMHRAGTSSVGGLLALFGAWPGPEPLLLRGDDNPKGHFEHGEIHMACLRRLAAAGGDWKSPASHAPPAAIDAFRREVAAVLETLEPQRPWVIKEPRLCLLARELLPMLTHPVFVHVTREPRAVADSLARRDGMHGGDALALWERYMREAFAASAGWPRIIVDYDALLAEPTQTARSVFDDLAAVGVSGLQMPSSAAILEWIDVPARVPFVPPLRLTASQQQLLDAISDRSVLDD